jgi:hypothetical protein
MAAPKFRLVAKNRSTGASAEFGVVWENDKGYLNIQFATATDAANSQGRKVAAADVIAKAQDYFFNIFENKPQGAAGKPAKKSVPSYAGEGSDIDF